MSETVDLAPDHVQLRHLFRQVQPSYLAATGGTKFIEKLVDLLDLPEDTNLNKYKVSRTKPANANVTNVSFYPFNRKIDQESYRKRIYELELPGLPAEASKADRKRFIDSVLPMKQELAIMSLGNLLKYLRENSLKWRHIFLSLDRNPIITNVLVFLLESQVLLDETTFQSLNIFSNNYHPSSFKNQVRKDGLSLFNMVNQCLSAVGVQELKSMLKQPSRDLNELNLRFATIEWCLKPENREQVVTLRESLKSLLNVNAVVARIIANNGKVSDWKSLKKTIYSSFMICELCANLKDDNIKGTVLHDLSSFYNEDQTVKGLLFALDKILDLEGEASPTKLFAVKEGIDPNLDEKRNHLREMVEECNGMALDESLVSVNDDQTAFRFVHFPELGFVVGTYLDPEEMNLQGSETDGIHLVLQTLEATYLRTPNCLKLNEAYQETLTEVIEIELKIYNRLIAYVNENLAELIDITKSCAKLDVLISFASVSALYKFVRPIITSGKEIKIVNGRHPLVETLKDFVPSTTIIDETNKNFINVISAPNASGKSVYIKQVALICYMAHVGLFVPADECTISLLHSIYTRIYTPESVYEGESAFMEDLQQMSKVVMNSTNKSLVLIDEFGKGTHYKDGIALLAASIEHFIDRGDVTPIAFITTHYPQVYDLIGTKERICIKTIKTAKNESGVFQSLYTIAEGTNAQDCSTEFPESRAIMKRIFDSKSK